MFNNVLFHYNIIIIIEGRKKCWMLNKCGSYADNNIIGILFGFVLI